MAQDLFTQLAQQTLANISTEGPAEVGDDPVSAIIQVAQERGIDPANLLGLAKLETQAGAKTVKGGGADTRNLFNVKDFSKDGNGIRARDGAEGSNDRYRAYGSYRESVEDLASLLERKYPGALKASSPEEFASELKRGGYATDPAYERKLASTIRSSGGAAARPAESAQEWDQGARYAPIGSAMVSSDKPQPAEKPSKRAGFWEGAADVGLSTAQGVVGSVKALTDLAGADNAASQGLDDASKRLEKFKSDASQQDRQYHQQKIKEAEASGDWQTEVAAYANMVWDMPLESLAQGVGSFATLGAGKVAQMAKLASAAKKAGVAKEAFLKTAQGIEAAKKASDLGMKVNVSLGVGQGIGGVKGSQYEQTYNAAKESGLSERQAQTLATEAQSYQQGWGQQALGAGLGYLAGKTGPIEKLAAGKTVGAGGVARRFVGGGLVEAGTEGLQGGQERYAGNAAAIDAGVLDESRRWAGVAGSGASEAITAGVLGGGAGALGRPDVDPQAQARAAAQQSGGIASRAGLAATPGAQQPNPAAPSQPAANPGANPGVAATTAPAGNTAAPAGNAGNTAAASTAPNPSFDGVTDEALANMGQFMTTRQTMTDGTPITEADRQVGRDALAELQRRRLVAKANPQPAQTPTQASALSAIEQALEADKQRRRAAGEVVDDDDVTDVEVKAPVQPGAEKLQLSDERDAMLPQAIDLLRQGVRPSVAAIQGQLRIGFNRAARILEEMERDGVVGPMDAQGARQILKLPDPPDAQANTPAQPASAGFSSPKFDNSPIPKTDPAEADEQRRQFAEFEQKRKNRRAGTRSAAWERNPFLAFLGANGLNRDTASEFAPGLTERRKAFVPGYGPVFRPGAKSLDELVQTAKEDGFLRDDDGEPELYDLIDRALRGERIAPLYADGAAEAEGQRRQQAMQEREGATFEDYLAQQRAEMESDDFDPFTPMAESGYDDQDLDGTDFDQVDDDVRAEVAALSAHYADMGFDPSDVLERLALENENQPEQQFYDLAKTRLFQLIEQAQGQAEPAGNGDPRADDAQPTPAREEGGQGQAAAVTQPAAPIAASLKRADAIRAKLDGLKSQGFSQFTKSGGRTLLLNPDTYETVELTPAEMAVAKAASGQARAGLQSLLGQRKPVQVSQQGADVLQSYTPADVLAQDEQAQSAQAQQVAEQQAAAAKAKADDERRRIEQASYAAADSFELGQNPLDSLTGQKDIFGAAPADVGLTAKDMRETQAYWDGLHQRADKLDDPAVKDAQSKFESGEIEAPEFDAAIAAAEQRSTRVAQDLAGERINAEWTAFDPQSGTLGIPRAEMPQIKAEHRGAMVNFLKARGIDGQQETIPATAIKPTQAEFSPEKVKKAIDYTGGNRSIIVSADGYVVDGHHQWLAAREKGEPIQAIRLDQNIGDVLAALKDMPSAQPEQAKKPEFTLDPLDWSPGKLADAYDMAQLNQLYAEVREQFSNPVVGEGPVDKVTGLATKERLDAQGRKMFDALQKAIDKAYKQKKAQQSAGTSPAPEAPSNQDDEPAQATLPSGAGQQSDEPVASRPFATAIEKTKTGWKILGDPDALAEHARDIFGKGVVKRKDGISLATKNPDVAGNFPVRFDEYRLADLPERHGRIEVRVNQDGSASVRSLDGGHMGPLLPSAAEAIADHRKTFGDGESVSAASEQSNAAGPAESSTKMPDASTGDGESPNAFIPAPNGSLDYGEITSEMSQAMRRQAGKIRLQRGNAAFGLRHIEERHGDEIRNSGFKSIEEFIAAAVSGIESVWKPAATSQLVVIQSTEQGRVVFIQLQAGKDESGDFYTVNTAFPSSRSYAEKRKEWKKLWSRVPVPAADTGTSASSAELGNKAGSKPAMESSQSLDGSVARPAQGAQAVWQSDPTLEAIFDQLDGITQRTQASGQQAAAAHPQAERIQLVQKHILDILEDLEDSGKVTINC